MAVQVTLNQLGVTFKVKMINAVTGLPFAVASNDTLSLEFTKPNGVKFSKVAKRVADTENAGTFFLVYRNANSGSDTVEDPLVFETSILDLTGMWTYQGKVVVNLDNDNFVVSAEKSIFWVVP